MRKLTIAFTVALLAGCAGQVQMMPRDSGKIYSGTVQGSPTGSGTMTIVIDGETYTGPIVRTTSGESFGLVQQFGRSGSSLGMVTTSGGTANVKGMLSSATGRGLRCDFTSTGGAGGGICVDDKSRVFDAIVSR